MIWRNSLFAATIVALPAALHAQPLEGFYVGAGAGASVTPNEQASARVYGFPGYVSGRLPAHVGPAVALSLGYGLGNGLRIELEGDYRAFSYDRNGISATERTFGPMVNMLYDLGHLIPVVQPYLGVGVGYQFVQESNVTAAEPGVAFRVRDSTQGNFAYQAIVGAALPIEAVPGLAVTASYRFMGLLGHRDYASAATVGAVPGIGVPGLGAATLPATTRLNNDFNHAIIIGVRYNFGQTPAPAPAPAPVAAPPSPVSRSYLVFFDWDKATLTDRARQIVSEAAANSTRVQLTRVEVNGYTDTSGTPRYNQRLSVRRAQTVAAELVRDGVPSNAIEIQGFGETHPLVPTGNGVREPQNRRVEIIIR